MSRHPILRILFALIAAGCLYGIVLSQREAPDRVIKIAFLASSDDEDYAGAKAFKNYVESRTGEDVAVQIYPSGQFCGNERECIEALQSGILEMHITTIGGVGNLFPVVQVLDLPYAFDSDALAECVFDGPLLEDLRKEILDRGLGIRLLVVGNTGGWRNFATTRTPVREPEDLQGLKIRTTPAVLQQELTRQLGANPTPVSWPEVYSALATGVVEGTKNGIPDIVSMNFHEHLDYIVLDRHSYMSALWWYSEAAWQRLTPEMRKLVREGAERLRRVTREMPKRLAERGFAEFRAAGGTVHEPTPEQKERFREAAAGMRSWFVDRYGRDWLDRLDRAIARCSAGTGSDEGDGL